jgi:uncharacterized protein
MNTVVWMALALVLILEGLGPMLFPTAWKKYLLSMTRIPNTLLRRVGGGIVVAGLVIFVMLCR